MFQVALGINATNGRNVLECGVNGSHFIVGSVQLGQLEQFSVDLIFDKGMFCSSVIDCSDQPVDFFVHGKSSIHLTGFYILQSHIFMLMAPDLEDERDFLESLKEETFKNKTSTQPVKQQKVEVPPKVRVLMQHLATMISGG